MSELLVVNGEKLNISDSHGDLQDVIIRFHINDSLGFTTFNPIIAVKDGSIIVHSNSYLTRTEIQNYNIQYRWYEEYYKIYDNIFKNYKNVINSTEFEVITERCFYLSNAFTNSNIGHALSIIFFIFSNYKVDNNLKFVIPENTLESVKKILLIFINQDQILQLKENITYKFENIFFPELPISTIMSIEQHTEPIKKIIDHVKTFNYEETYLNKKVFLVKQKNKNTRGAHGFVITEELKQYLESKDVLIIKPEDICVYKLIFILLHASIIFTSGGAVSYAHMIFFNKDAKLFFIPCSYLYSNQLNFTYIPNISVSELQKVL